MHRLRSIANRLSAAQLYAATLVAAAATSLGSVWLMAYLLRD